MEASLQTLLQQLHGYGNHVTSLHAQALRDLLTGLGSQALRLAPGRVAYALPCGGGKTQAIVALIATARELIPELSFSVAASQIMALARLKRDLVAAGVPSADIGMRHSSAPNELARIAIKNGESDLIPFLSDTADLECPIMLVCHARVLGSTQLPSCFLFRGAKRDLMIWDESLITTKATALPLRDAIGAAERISKELPESSVLCFTLREMAKAVQDEHGKQVAGAIPNPSVTLCTGDLDTATTELDNIGRFGTRFRQEALLAVRTLLQLAKEPVSIARTGNGLTGDGIIRFSIAVSPDLDNIAILDASFPIRMLARDIEIRDGTTPSMRSFKRFSSLKIFEKHSPSGKVGLMQSREKREALARDVAAYIRTLPENDFVLVFTHKGDASLFLQTEMRRDLQTLGVSVDAMINGRPRFNWLTWGNETGLNNAKHCSHVILCGVTRRSPLDLAAALAGLHSDLGYRPTRQSLDEVMLSEAAHGIFQAINRGICRNTGTDGTAPAMSVAIFASFKGLRSALNSSLPEAEWTVLPVSQSQLKISAAATAIADYLEEQTSEERVSVTKLRKTICAEIGPDAITKAIDDALVILALRWTRGGCRRWKRDSRSLSPESV